MSNLGEHILGWYHLEPLQIMFKETKTNKSFFLAFYFKCCHNYDKKLSCLSIACTNIWLEVYFGILKIQNCSKFVLLIKMAPLKIESQVNFGKSWSNYTYSINCLIKI
jgi:hypothetical protein